MKGFKALETKGPKDLGSADMKTLRDQEILRLRKLPWHEDSETKNICWSLKTPML